MMHPSASPPFTGRNGSECRHYTRSSTMPGRSVSFCRAYRHDGCRFREECQQTPGRYGSFTCVRARALLDARQGFRLYFVVLPARSPRPAEVAELADAQASGACGRKAVEVRALSSAPFDTAPTGLAP